MTKKDCNIIADGIFSLSVCDYGLEGIRKIVEAIAEKIEENYHNFDRKAFFQRCGV